MSQAVRVYGIDPSLSSTGVACVYVEPANSVHWAWTERITTAERGCQRIDRICRQAAVLMSSARSTSSGLDDAPVLVVIEGPIYATPKVKTAIGDRVASLRGYHERAGLWWALCSRLWRMGLPFAVAPPSSIKMWATGKGNAREELVMSRMISAMSPHVVIDSNDEADALAAALMGAHKLLSRPVLVEHTAYREDALDGVEWPILPAALGFAGPVAAAMFDHDVPLARVGDTAIVLDPDTLS